MSARADTRVGPYMRIMKRLSMMTAALGAAVAVLVALTVPAKRIPLTPFDDGTIVGIVHVHTNRSDGLSDPDTIAAAAARAGLKFLVFTDHGDGMRKPDAEIFVRAAELLGLEPAECVFVDDLEQNAEGARAVGMEAIVHRSARFTVPKLEELLGVPLTSDDAGVHSG